MNRKISALQRLPRKEWLRRICSPEWPEIKPKLTGFRLGDPESALVRMLIDKDTYAILYGRYLKVRNREIPSALLEILPDKVLDRIRRA
jgi:hypothetical protein